MRILLIDDDPAVLEVVALMLGAEGHEVIAVGRGRDGLDRLEGGASVDLVLTDLAMPGMSGWEVVRAVRARWPGLPVGLVTGTPHHQPDLWEPVDLFIDKPVSLEALRAALARIRG